MISRIEVGSIMAEGELSTRITTFPSRRQAAAVSGRSVNLNFGNGLNHFRRKSSSARLCWFMRRSSVWMASSFFVMFFKRASSARSDI